MHCGDHILFWWAIGLGLWPVHGFCAQSLGVGGGGRRRRNSPLIQIVMLRIILLIQGSGGSAETDDPTP